MRPSSGPVTASACSGAARAALPRRFQGFEVRARARIGEVGGQVLRAGRRTGTRPAASIGAQQRPGCRRSRPGVPALRSPSFSTGSMRSRWARSRRSRSAADGGPSSVKRMPAASSASTTPRCRAARKGCDRARDLATDVGQRLQQLGGRAAHELSEPSHCASALAVVSPRCGMPNANRKRGSVALARLDAATRFSAQRGGKLAGRVDGEVRAQEAGVAPAGALVGEQRQALLVDGERALAVRRRLHQVGRGPGIERRLHPHQVLDGERVELGGGMHEAELDQRLGLAVAQALDVHRPARGEVPYRLLALRRAR